MANKIERMVKSALDQAFPGFVDPDSTVGQTANWSLNAAPPDQRNQKVYAVELRRFGSSTFGSKSGQARVAVAFTIVRTDYDYMEGPDPKNMMRAIIDGMLKIEGELEGLRVYSSKLMGSRRVYQDKSNASATFTMISEFELAFTGLP